MYKGQTLKDAAEDFIEQYYSFTNRYIRNGYAELFPPLSCNTVHTQDAFY